MNLLRCSMMVLCIAMATIGRAQVRSALPDAGETLAGPALAQALQRGGFTLYFRHARTDFSQNDRDMKGFDDCAKQRDLEPRQPIRGDRRGAASRGGRGRGHSRRWRALDDRGAHPRRGLARPELGGPKVKGPVAGPFPYRARDGNQPPGLPPLP